MSSLSGTNTQDSSDDSCPKEEADIKLKASPGTEQKSKSQRFLSQSAESNSCSSVSYESTASLDFNSTRRRKKKPDAAKRLPPLGIFWDIENCAIPKFRSAFAVVQKFRSVFLKNYREAEFIIVCDVKKESSSVIEELHDAQVNIVHVAAVSKNAADDKLRQAVRRFADAYPAPSAVVLITSDINFASELCELRYRKKIRVILVHNHNAADALILSANEHYLYKDITDDLPVLMLKDKGGQALLHILNLPVHIEKNRIKCRLKTLVDNCGGKVVGFTSSSSVLLKFATDDCALRAQKRIQGEHVYGSKIKVVTHSLRNFSGQKVKSLNGSLHNGQASFMPSYQQDYNQSEFQNSFMDQVTRDQRKSQESDAGIYHSGRGASGIASEINFEKNWSLRGDNVTQTQPGCNQKPQSADLIEDGKLREPIDLVISNLDPTIDVKELRKLLTNMLKEYVMILSLNITVHSDGSPVANIRVNSQQEAQFAISQLHRQKLGHKRIVISYAQNNNLPDPEQLRAMVISLLQEVPENPMPLFKFIELLESRYHCQVSVSEVNKLKDICKITDDHGCRIISLTQEVKEFPPPNLTQTFLPYCTTHCPNGLQSRGWCELSTVQTPSVMISLQIFANKVHNLLTIHLGSMPLLSFQVCYEQEFHEPLPVVEHGVPVEHLLTCIPDVEVIYVGPNKNIKYIKREFRPMESDEEALSKIVPPPLAPNLSLFCRELVDLLKTTERCQLHMSKFIPAYHHHFGRQCRVADYGFTKLLDLFESMSHVVQIMGDGTRRILTLSHHAQMRRFTSDLLRVLKVQPSKQLPLTEFPSAYEKVMQRPFNAVEYGLCTFEDLLDEVPENTVVVSRGPAGVVMALPKREQTAEEVARTKQFAAEVVDLLKHSPYYSMLFNKFVPAYHHHFGHQCKVSDYGFSKLIELFEAIPDVVKIEEMADNERMVTLTLPKLMKVLGSQILALFKNAKQQSIPLEELPHLFIREYGYPLKPEVYEKQSVVDVIQALDEVQVIQTPAGFKVMAIEIDCSETVKIRLWALLLKPPHSKKLDAFQYEYQSLYNSTFTFKSIQNLNEVVQLTNHQGTEYISLTSMYVVAAQLYRVLFDCGGSVVFSSLEKYFTRTFGESLSSYNIKSVDELYSQFPFLFFVRTIKKKCVISLNRNLAEHLVALPREIYNPNHPSVTRRDSNQWPPQPLPDILNSHKKAPPKPDSPPTPGGVPWKNWQSPDASRFSIHLPIIENPVLLGNPYNLISPARQLVWHGQPWKDMSPGVKAPDPSELPVPDKFLYKSDCLFDDEFKDSGLQTTRLEHSTDYEGATSLLHQHEDYLKAYLATNMSFHDLE